MIDAAAVDEEGQNKHRKQPDTQQYEQARRPPTTEVCVYHWSLLNGLLDECDAAQFVQRFAGL